MTPLATIEELERLESEATVGPWQHGKLGDGRVIDSGHLTIATFNLYPYTLGERDATQGLTIALRNNAKSLLSDARLLREAVGLVKRWYDCFGGFGVEPLLHDTDAFLSKIEEPKLEAELSKEKTVDALKELEQ